MSEPSAQQPDGNTPPERSREGSGCTESIRSINDTDGRRVPPSAGSRTSPPENRQAKDFMPGVIEVERRYELRAARLIVGTSLVFYHGDRAHFLDLVTRVADALDIHRDDAGDLIHQLINDEHDHRLATIESVYTRIDLTPKLMQAYGLCSPARAYERADRRAAEKRKAVAS
jgi:hypothetical protein